MLGWTLDSRCGRASALGLTKVFMKHEPTGWGKDRLTDFFNAADANMRATFVRKKSWANKLIGINDVFQDAQVNSDDEGAVILSLLKSRSHHAYLAACRLGF